MPSDPKDPEGIKGAIKTTPTAIIVDELIEKKWEPLLPDACRAAQAAACDEFRDTLIDDKGNVLDKDGNIVELQAGPELEACLRKLFQGLQGSESQPEIDDEGDVVNVVR